MDDFIRSTLKYDIRLDDFYWGIAYAPTPNPGTKEIERIPREIYVEDARFIQPIADEYGHLGGYDYFCPVCYERELDKVDIRNLRDTQKLDPRCPKCGRPLVQTCYVQEINSKVTARFGRDEILHGSSDRTLPDLFGEPKLVSAWKMVKTIDEMIEYNWQVYSLGKIGSLVVIPGVDQEDVDEMLTNMTNQVKQFDRRDIQTAEARKTLKIHQFFVGLPEARDMPVKIPLMEDHEKLQSLDFFKLYVEKVCGLYGVTPIFVSVIEATRAGVNPRMQIDVQNRTTRKYQADIEDLFNDELAPLFGITDWLFKFGKVEGRDLLREAQIEREKATTIMTLVRAGYKVKIGDDWRLIVDSEPVRDPMQIYPSRQEGGRTPFDQRPPDVPAEELLILGEQIKDWNNKHKVNPLPRLPKEDAVQSALETAHETDVPDERLHLYHLRNLALIETLASTACKSLRHPA